MASSSFARRVGAFSSEAAADADFVGSHGGGSATARLLSPAALRHLLVLRPAVLQRLPLESADDDHPNGRAAAAASELAGFVVHRRSASAARDEILESRVLFDAGANCFRVRVAGRSEIQRSRLTLRQFMQLAGTRLSATAPHSRSAARGRPVTFGCCRTVRARAVHPTLTPTEQDPRKATKPPVTPAATVAAITSAVVSLIGSTEDAEQARLVLKQHLAQIREVMDERCAAKDDDALVELATAYSDAGAVTAVLEVLMLRNDEAFHSCHSIGSYAACEAEYALRHTDGGGVDDTTVPGDDDGEDEDALSDVDSDDCSSTGDADEEKDDGRAFGSTTLVRWPVATDSHQYAAVGMGGDDDATAVVTTMAVQALASDVLKLLLMHSTEAVLLLLPRVVALLRSRIAYSEMPLLRAVRWWRQCPGVLEGVMVGGGTAALLSLIEAIRSDEARADNAGGADSDVADDYDDDVDAHARHSIEGRGGGDEQSLDTTSAALRRPPAVPPLEIPPRRQLTPADGDRSVEAPVSGEWRVVQPVLDAPPGDTPAGIWAPIERHALLGRCSTASVAAGRSAAAPRLAPLGGTLGGGRLIEEASRQPRLRVRMDSPVEALLAGC